MTASCACAGPLKTVLETNHGEYEYGVIIRIFCFIFFSSAGYEKRKLLFYLNSNENQKLYFWRSCS